MENIKDFKINFVGIGAPRCGTTWVSAILKQHPEIDFARSKETNYYLSEQAPVRKENIKFSRRTNLKEYKRQFKNNGNIKGEFSIYYLYDEASLRKIKKDNPDVKILICIRDTIDFLYSCYKFDKTSNMQKSIPDNFIKAVESNKIYDLLHKERAYFFKYIEKVYKIFSKENILIIDLKNIKKEPKKTAKKIYKYLEVNPEYIPNNYLDKINSTRSIKYSFINKIVKNIILILNKTNLGFIYYKYILGNRKIVNFYNRYFKAEDKFKELEFEEKEYINNIFKQDIDKLKEILK